MYNLYNKKLEINMNTESLRIFQKYMDIKYNLNFDSFVPVLEFNDKEFISKVVNHYSQTIFSEAKYRAPTDLLHIANAEKKPINSFELKFY